jgi:hypothetical protein
VADVAIGDGDEFHMMSQACPLDGGACGFVFGIIRMCAENDDAEPAVVFLLRVESEGGEAEDEREEGAEHGGRGTRP